MKKLSLLFAMVLLSFASIFARPVQAGPEPQVIQKAFELLETHIANPYWLDTDAYREFKQLMLAEESLQLEWEAYIQRFNREKQKLPFTHFNLHVKSTRQSDATPIPYEWRAVREDIAYLDINSFIADAPGMFRTVQEIEAGDFDHLIIDLRGNTGGSLDMAVVLGQYLTNQPIDAGLYLSRAWYETSEAAPAVAEYGQFPFLQDMTFEGFGKMLDREKGFRMVLPGHDRKTFAGKVFVLMDHDTGSTCEPLVDLLKKIDRAALVGTATAGAMLSGRGFRLSEEVSVFLPVADYLTASGTRIDKVGVTPHYEVEPDQAFDFVLERLINP